MANFDEGAIKFKIISNISGPLQHPLLPELIEARNELFRMGLIGVYENGIGYGNISCRTNDCQFIISGTQTGHIPIATKDHFCLVESCDIDRNELMCSGPVKASSESMTHYAFYRGDPSINCVIHVHNKSLWNSLRFKMRTTDESIRYGTPELAYEIMRLLTITREEPVIITAGHEDGVFVFAGNIEDTMIILSFF